MADAEDLGAVTEHATQMNAGAQLLGDGRLQPGATAAGHDVKRAKAVLGHYVNAAATDDSVLKAFDPVLSVRRGGGERGVGAD